MDNDAFSKSSYFVVAMIIHQNDKSFIFDVGYILKVGRNENVRSGTINMNVLAVLKCLNIQICV